MGVRQTGLNQLYELKATRNGLEIISDFCHILSQYYNVLPSGRRLRAFRTTKADNEHLYRHGNTIHQ